MDIKNILVLILVLMLGTSYGCSDIKSAKPAAEAAVLEFHNQYNAEDYKSIFENAHESFKKTDSFENFIVFMQAVYSKLGKVQSTENVNWQIGNYNLKTSVSLRQKTKFENGSGVESFNYRIEGEKAILIGYNINSRDLIIK